MPLHKLLVLFVGRRNVLRLFLNIPLHKLPVLLAFLLFLFTTACDDDDDNNQLPVLENKERIECERRSGYCNGKDAMRFYRSTPLIQSTPDSGIKITEVWSSFVVCCDVFQQLMDSLTVYNDLLTEANREGAGFTRTGMVDSISISVGVEYYDLMNGKRWEWLQFGDSTFSWPMPTGEYFAPYKEQLEEAHKRCCLL